VRLRLDVAYDGTHFAGWASQPGQHTVQGTLEAALERVLRLAVPARLTVAGRTDAGVHARGQVCHVDVPQVAYEAMRDRRGRRPDQVVRDRLLGVLPLQVRVRRVAPAPAGFDARFSAVARRYAYRICDDPGLLDPLRRHEILLYPRRVDVDAMDGAAQLLLGEHDFAAYCRRREGASTVRALREFHWERGADDLVCAHVVADAFCHSMVRSLVGACLAVGEGRKPASWPAEVLRAGARDSGVMVVGPQGLTLEEVRYPDSAGLAARAAEARRPRGEVGGA